MYDLLCVLLVDTIGAAGLGALAFVVWRRSRSAPLAHGLALLALVKLVTPPLFELSVFPDYGAAAPIAMAEPAAMVDLLGGSGLPAEVSTAGGNEDPAPLTAHLTELVFAVWAAGALAVLVIMWRRARRFARLLDCAESAPVALRTTVKELSRDLGLRREPRVVIVDAQIPPNVFALGRRPVLVFPRMLVARLDRSETRAVVAHELCHLANHDHWTRLLECLVVVVHWWNPVALGVRRLIREVEELRCDARAVDLLGTSPKRYGRTILEVTSHLASAPIRLPLGASGLGGAETLKRRLTMIAAHRLTHRLAWPAKLTLALGASALLPLGVAAQEKHEHEVEVELERAGSSDDVSAMLKKLEKMLAKISKRVQAEGKGEHKHEVHVVGPDGSKKIRVSKGKGGGFWVQSGKDGVHKIQLGKAGKGGGFWVQSGKDGVHKIQLGKGKGGGVWLQSGKDGVHQVQLGKDKGKSLRLRGVHEFELDAGKDTGVHEHVIVVGPKGKKVTKGKGSHWYFHDGEGKVVIKRGDVAFDVGGGTVVRAKKAGKVGGADTFFVKRGNQVLKADKNVRVFRVGPDGLPGSLSAGKRVELDVLHDKRHGNTEESEVGSLRRRVRQLERQLRELKKKLGRKYSL